MKINLSYNQEKEGYENVDINKLEENSVEEVYSKNLVATMDKKERCEFFNKLHKAMKTGATAQLILPSWNNTFGYGHPHFKEPLYEGFLYFLSKEWRETNAKEVTELECDFEATWGYNMHPSLNVRNQEYQQFALANYINSSMEMVITLKKK